MPYSTALPKSPADFLRQLRHLLPDLAQRYRLARARQAVLGQLGCLPASLRGDIGLVSLRQSISLVNRSDK